MATGRRLSTLIGGNVLVLSALMAFGCASTADRTSTEEERYTLLNSVKPTTVHTVSDHQRMRVWVLVDDAGVFTTRVCTDYKETGSRIWRNSCRKNVAGPLRVVRGGIFNQPLFWDTSLSNAAIARNDATDLEKTLDTVLNAEVEIIDLDEVTLEPINQPNG